VKKSKVLIVLLIGLLLAVGLALTGCQYSCHCGQRIVKENGNERLEHKKCDQLFCAKNIAVKQDCNCLDHYIIE
jgi:hypothetical protein